MGCAASTPLAKEIPRRHDFLNGKVKKLSKDTQHFLLYLPEYRNGREEFLLAKSDKSEEKILRVLEIAAQVVTLEDVSMRIDVFRYMFHEGKSFDEAQRAAEKDLEAQLEELGALHPPETIPH